MQLKNLKLLNFRNYDNLYLEFNPNINLFIGKNGQGKTNIVESVYMMSFSKSFRTNKDKELIKFDKENMYVGGNFTNSHSEGLIEIFLVKNKKGIKLNKLSIHKVQDLLGNLNIVIFSPEDLKLVKDSPRERRSFIDKEISQIMPVYYSYLVNYNKILYQRNKLLKNSNIDTSLLDVYDESLANCGSYICLIRKNFIKKIYCICNKIHKNLTGDSENLEIFYKTQIEIVDEDTRETIYQKLLDKLSSSRKNDIKFKMTRYGIHKDDIAIYINNIDAKMYGSQGQQRMVSISLKLSEIEIIKSESGEYPILILDDVFSELDENRQRLLINNLKDVQMFITTAENSHKDIFNKNNTTIFNIENGKVIKVENNTS